MVKVLQCSLGFLEIVRNPQGSIGFFRVPQGSLGLLRIPQGSLGFFRVPQGSLGFLRAPQVFLGFLMVSSLGFLQDSIGNFGSLRVPYGCLCSLSLLRNFQVPLDSQTSLQERSQEFKSLGSKSLFNINLTLQIYPSQLWTLLILKICGFPIILFKKWNPWDPQ